MEATKTATGRVVVITCPCRRDSYSVAEVVRLDLDRPASQTLALIKGHYGITGPAVLESVRVIGWGPDAWVRFVHPGTGDHLSGPLSYEIVDAAR